MQPNDGAINYGKSNEISSRGFEIDMEGILQLMNQRAKGQVSNDHVEAAVREVIESMGTKAVVPPKNQTLSPNLPTSMSFRHPNAKRKRFEVDSAAAIEVDTSNYDGEDDKYDSGDTGVRDPPKQPTSKTMRRNQKEKQGISNSLDNIEEPDETQYNEKLAQIPMGSVGAKMMTTFGDGARPNLQALEMALMGTRKSLQVAVMDARALRRRLTASFDHAKKIVLADKARPRKANGIIQPQEFSSSPTLLSHENPMTAPILLYRALESHDPLSKQSKAGFDVEQLTWLYPEEMSAYQRWNELHAAYQQSQDQGQRQNLPQQRPQHSSVCGGSREQNDFDGGDDPPSVTAERNTDGDGSTGGHLRERAAVFDCRTYRMKKDNYMQFSKVRRGSFLPRGSRTRKSPIEIEWEQKNQNLGAGAKGFSWHRMSATEVRFLHWLGFEPPTIPPPDDETTQALGFLGYDRMGRIVEKAIYLRNLEKRKKKNASNIPVIQGSDDLSSVALRQLEQGETLTREDIDRALKEPDIMPAPLFPFREQCQLSSSMCRPRLPNVQLYFGPGFEERMELELDEMLTSSKRQSLITPNEQQLRQQEQVIFEKMSQPPIEGDALVHLLDKQK